MLLACSFGLSAWFAPKLVQGLVDGLLECLQGWFQTITVVRFADKPWLTGVGFTKNAQVVQKRGHGVVKSIVGVHPVPIIAGRRLAAAPPAPGRMSDKTVGDASPVENGSQALS